MTNQPFNETVISSSLTVGKLIEILQHFPKDALVDSVRLKAADNAIYADLNQDGELVICD